MICYRCGYDAGNHLVCPHCDTDLEIFQKVVKISNEYYNDGLMKAQVRNLSGAIISLKKSLKFYKYNTDARNLLGLVFYETGEVVQALSEWVISANYQPDDNKAKDYLKEIHNNRNQLNAINQTIKKYNQALLYCKQESRDLAIIQLKKVLSLNPKLVKGHQLLALLYMQEGHLEKAKHSLRNAGKIDTDNTTTLRYLKEVNRRLKEKGSSKKKKNDDLISYQSGNETIIMPKRFRESSIGATILSIVLGIGVGVAVTAFLIVPNVKNTAKEDAKKQLIQASDTISTNGQTIDDLNDQIDSLNAQLDEAKAQNEAVNTKFSSYEALLSAYVTYTSGDVIATGDALASIDTSLLSESAMGTYNTLNDTISAPYIDALYNRAYASYGRGNYDSAIQDFLKVIAKDQNFKSGSAVYYLAQSYRKAGDNGTAVQYYQYVIDNFPGTEKARTSANYINTTN